MMKNRSTLFLQVVTVLIGLVSLGILIRFPLTEGRAENLGLFSIYADPFILYIYAASTPFFIALYKLFLLIGYIGHNEAFSLKSVKALRDIKYCAIAVSILILLAGLWIRLFHNKEDDPAGFLALCLLTIFVSLVFATAVTVFENILQHGIDLKLENQQIYEHTKK
jgi:Protein of unknown function (DUF2975)